MKFSDLQPLQGINDDDEILMNRPGYGTGKVQGSELKNLIPDTGGESTPSDTIDIADSILFVEHETGEKKEITTGDFIGVLENDHEFVRKPGLDQFTEEVSNQLNEFGEDLSQFPHTASEEHEWIGFLSNVEQWLVNGDPGTLLTKVIVYNPDGASEEVYEGELPAGTYLLFGVHSNYVEYKSVVLALSGDGANLYVSTYYENPSGMSYWVKTFSPILGESSGGGDMEATEWVEYESDFDSRPVPIGPVESNMQFFVPALNLSSLALSSSVYFYSALDEWIPTEMRRTIYRGRPLGTFVTDAQWQTIKEGLFYNMFIGDYWEIAGVKYIIADFDYSMDVDGRHGVLLFPNKNLKDNVLWYDKLSGYQNYSYYDSNVRSIMSSGISPSVRNTFGGVDNMAYTKYSEPFASMTGTLAYMDSRLASDYTILPTSEMLSGYRVPSTIYGKSFNSLFSGLRGSDFVYGQSPIVSLFRMGYVIEGGQFWVMEPLDEFYHWTYAPDIRYYKAISMDDLAGIRPFISIGGG